MRTTEEKEKKYMCMNQAYTEENTLYIWGETFDHWDQDFNEILMPVTEWTKSSKKCAFNLPYS